MDVVFISNYINHHQLPLAKAFNSLPGVDYTFVATTPFDQSRAQMGYKDENTLHDFVLKAYEGERQEKAACALAKEADIVLIGSAPDYYMAERLRLGKATFHVSERYFRKELSIKTFPRYFASAMKHIRPFQGLPLYYLCSSAYTAKDVNTFTSFKSRCFKWAYFTEVREFRECDLVRKREENEKPVILWVGRFLSWKHPDAAIRAAGRLRAQGHDFRLDIIGGGSLELQLKMLVHELNLEDTVRFLGFLSPEAVRKHMERADIFLFTSDFNEGWGAVLNEAMSSGCAAVASHACGASPFLVRDGQNGYLYMSGEEEHLFERTEQLLLDKSERQRLGIEAYRDMHDMWSPQVAAKRLINLNTAIVNGHDTKLYVDGPCSPAPIIRNEWYKDVKDT